MIMRRKKKVLRIIIEPNTPGYHAYCPELKGLHAPGDTKEDALLNALNACIAYIESLKEHNEKVFGEEKDNG